MTRHKAQRHTVENLSVELKDTFTEYGISNKVSVGVTDNANNVKAAVALIDDVGQMGCFAHTLNVAVKHAVEDDQRTKCLVKKVKDIVHYFNASTVALNELKERHEIEGSKFVKLKQEVETRWNSKYLMLESYKQQHDAVKIVLTLRGKADLLLTE